MIRRLKPNRTNTSTGSSFFACSSQSSLSSLLNQTPFKLSQGGKTEKINSAAGLVVFTTPSVNDLNPTNYDIEVCLTATSDQEQCKKILVRNGLANYLFSFMGRWVARIILVVSILITVLAWYIAKGEENKRANGRFNFRIQTLKTAIYERPQSYNFLLQGWKGLF